MLVAVEADRHNTMKGHIAHYGQVNTICGIPVQLASGLGQPKLIIIHGLHPANTDSIRGLMKPLCRYCVLS